MSSQRVFELRTYTSSPGHFDALVNRFREPTIQLFTKHGMQLEGFWEVLSESDAEQDCLVYLLSFADLADATEKWAAFRADPEWLKARADTEAVAGGMLVASAESHYMTSTDFSPLV